MLFSTCQDIRIKRKEDIHVSSCINALLNIYQLVFISFRAGVCLHPCLKQTMNKVYGTRSTSGKTAKQVISYVHFTPTYLRVLL